MYIQAECVKASNSNLKYRANIEVEKRALENDRIWVYKESVQIVHQAV